MGTPHGDELRADTAFLKVLRTVSLLLAIEFIWEITRCQSKMSSLGQEKGNKRDEDNSNNKGQLR